MNWNQRESAITHFVHFDLFVSGSSGRRRDLNVNLNLDLKMDLDLDPAVCP